MAAQGATLQNYNNELVKCVDDLKEKREEVNKAILKDVRAIARALLQLCWARAAGASGRVVGAPVRGPPAASFPICCSGLRSC